MSKGSEAVSKIEALREAFERIYPLPGEGDRGMVGGIKYTPTTLSARNSIVRAIEKIAQRALAFDAKLKRVPSAKSGSTRGSARKKRPARSRGLR